MPLLGGLLVNLFGGLVAFLVTWVSRKVAFGLAAVAMSSALTLALFVLMRSLLAALNSYTTGVPAIFVQALAMMIPPAAPFVIASYITIWTATMVYTWQRDLIVLFAKAG
ncbi:hypothetical protein D9M68_963790 [compost metagenome]